MRILRCEGAIDHAADLNRDKELVCVVTMMSIYSAEEFIM